jgi:Domain of unknown function (DUF4426)
MRILWLGFFLWALSVSAFAQIDQTKEISTSQKAGNYTVHFNVFNSTDIPASVAEQFKLVRGKDRALVNISLVKNESGNTSLGLPAIISGTTRNLMQQKQDLKFIEVKEGDVTYYLAPFVFNNEDLLYFDIQVKTNESSSPILVQFNRTLYKD